MAADGQPRTRMRREDRARQLLDLTEAMVLKGGLAGFTMERLAAEAGVAKTVVYSHFRNASDAAVALLRRHWAEIDAEAVDLSRDDRPLEADLREVATGYFGASGRRRVLRRLMTELARDPVAAGLVRARVDQRSVRLARRLERAYGFAPERAALAAAMVTGLVTSIADAPAARQLTVGDLAEAYVAAALGLVEGLKA